jgi:hypothetical protein
MSVGMKLQTYARLGPSNLARVLGYRLGLKIGLHPILKLRAEVARRPFFHLPERGTPVPAPNSAWNNALWRFGWHSEALTDAPPDWFANPFSNAVQPDTIRDWWRIPDFGGGDIKGVWELSRFNWAIAWANCAVNGDPEALDRLNEWLADWAEKNPPYRGPNWKCGQEASIRVIYMVLAAWMLDQEQAPLPGLIALLRTHLQRIAPTISYAIGQQNNHGTSEAAALFIGGTFLSGHEPRSEGWACMGRRWLEERAKTLIEPDGSFSQYSVTYHRLMLDTYSLAEAWRRHSQLPAFSAELRARLAAATDWLWTLTDAENGDAPNIGANDGAHLLQLTGSDYRDFRPSVQLAAALFLEADAFGPGPWNAPLDWLGIPHGEPARSPNSSTFDDGGYHVLRIGNAMAVMRYPRFRFRPSQADALHVDLWYKGENVLRDAGTFSYNYPESEWFASTAAHNTVEFDRRDQMPRLGRFLFGDWLEVERSEPVRSNGREASAAAAYSDAQGARHSRAVTLTAAGLVCRDEISGNFEEACLRWRLAPGDWQSSDYSLSSNKYSLTIEIDGALVRPSLGRTEESRYYQQRTEIPLAFIKVTHPATIVTRVTF